MFFVGDFVASPGIISLRYIKLILVYWYLEFGRTPEHATIGLYN